MLSGLINQAAGLEVEARAKLDNARIVGGGDTAKVGAIDVKDATALADEEVSTIEDIERLKTKLKVSGFSHLNVSE